MYMDVIIRDIERAEQCNAFFSALALALTIPDVCAKAEKKYPQKDVAYVEWCNHWCNFSNMFSSQRYKNAFNGAHCYALRCAFLHNLDADMQKQKKAFRKTGDEGKEFTFVLTVPNDCNDLTARSILEDDDENSKMISIICKDITKLLVDGYRKFRNENADITIENKGILIQEAV